jgi:hypothetical protein
MKKST